MKNKLEKQIRVLLILFITCLCISGITASFIETELRWINSHFVFQGELGRWLSKTLDGMVQTNYNYPFIAYSADWLAFSHMALALFFIGPLLRPIENRWIITYGMIICVAVFPLAFVAGYFREIPLFWQLIDCSFGLFGGTLLWVILRKIDHLEMAISGKITRSRRSKLNLPRLTAEM